MRKVLLATTAMTAISLAGVASAQESEMMSAAGNTIIIGGYYEFGYTSFSDDVDVADDSGEAKTYGDSELFIDFETTSDAGLTYGVQVDLEVVTGNSHAKNGGANHTDESSLYISGDFGTVEFGHNDHAYASFQIWPPTHEGAFGSWDSINGGLTARVDNNSANNVDVLYSAAERGPNDDNAKIIYISPNFSGFKFGVSAADSDSAKDNPTSIGASYGFDVGDVTIKFAAATVSNNADDAAKSTGNTYGISAGLGSLTLTASRFGGDSGADEQEVTEFGVGYQITDSLSVGASHASSETEGPGKDHEGDFQSVSGEYAIAPGLTTNLAINQFDVSNNNTRQSNDGSEVTWQIEFAF